MEITELIPLILFSFLAFWKRDVILFMITGALALFYGFYWFDAYMTNLAMTVSLVLFAYAFLCEGFALALIFWHEEIG